MNVITQLLLLFFFVFPFASFNTTQEQELKSIGGANLKTRLEAALKDARSNHPHSLVWVGYAFSVRHGVSVEITPEPGTENQNLGLFFLYDTDVNAVKRFAVYNMDQKREYRRPAYWLGKVENNASLEFLKELVIAKTGDPLAPYLIEAIAMHDGPQADAVLKEMADRPIATYWLRERATACPSSKDLPGNVPALTEILRNEQESMQVREQAAQALGVCADPAGVDALAAFYKSSQDPTVRKLALKGATHKVNHTSITLFLEAAANETDPQLKQAAYDWLADKTGRRLAWNLEPGLRLFATDLLTEEENATLMKTLGGSPDESVSQLIKIAETDTKIRVRKAAAMQLGKLGGERVLAFFRKVLSQDVKGLTLAEAWN